MGRTWRRQQSSLLLLILLLKSLGLLNLLLQDPRPDGTLIRLGHATRYGRAGFGHSAVSSPVSHYAAKRVAEATGEVEGKVEDHGREWKSPS
jgi:hypothetical protein